MMASITYWNQRCIVSHACIHTLVATCNVFITITIDMYVETPARLLGLANYITQFDQLQC